MAIFLSLLFLQPAVAEIESGNYHFSLEMFGKSCGFSDCQIWEEQTKDGKKIFRVFSDSILRISSLGQPQDQYSKTWFVLDGDSAEILYYKRRNQRGKIFETLEGKKEENDFILKRSINGKIISYQAFGWNEKSAILDDEIITWLLLTQKTKGLMVNIPDKILVPREGIWAEFSTLGDTEKKNPYVKIKVQEQIAKVFWKMGKLVEIDIPEQHTKVIPARKGARKDIGRVEVSEPFLSKVSEPLPPLSGIEILDIKIDAVVFGEEIQKEFLSSNFQKFVGTVENGKFIKGKFTVTAREYSGDDSKTIPTKKIFPGNFEKYILPEIGIESDDERIISQAKEITQGINDAWTAAIKIANWVHEEVDYEDFLQGSALTTLLLKKGDCGEISKLAVAMCRAVGISARPVGGLIYNPMEGGVFSPYYWFEIYPGGNKVGWVPLDSTLREFTDVNPTHIKLCSVGGLTNFSLEVIGYQEKEDKTGLKKKAIWEDVKEQKWIFSTDGKNIGTLTSTTEKVEGAKMDDLFLLKCELSLDSRGTANEHEMEQTSELYFDRKGSPVAYMMEGSIDGDEEKIECRVEEKTISQFRKKNTERIENTLESPPDTFLLDHNMICHWDVVCRLVPLKIGKKVQFNAWSPYRMTGIPVEIFVRSVENLNIDGIDIPAFRCEVEPIKETFWINAKEGLVQIENQRANLTIRKEWL